MRYHLKNLGMIVDNWKQAANWNPLKYFIKKGWGKKIELAEQKHAFHYCHESWKFDMFNYTLLSKVRYVSHIKLYNDLQMQAAYSKALPPFSENTTCVLCGKVCWEIPGLKGHMRILKNAILLADLMTFVSN